VCWRSCVSRALPILRIAGNHDCWGRRDSFRADVGLDTKSARGRRACGLANTHRPRRRSPRVEDRKYACCHSAPKPNSITLFRWAAPGFRICAGGRLVEHQPQYQPRDGGAGLRSVAEAVLQRAESTGAGRLRALTRRERLSGSERAYTRMPAPGWTNRPFCACRPRRSTCATGRATAKEVRSSVARPTKKDLEAKAESDVRGTSLTADRHLGRQIPQERSDKGVRAGKTGGWPRAPLPNLPRAPSVL